MEDVKYVIEKQYPTGKSVKQPEIPLGEQVQALALRWIDGVDPDEIVSDLFAKHDRAAPKHGAQVLSGWARKIDRLVGSGDAEALRLCHDAGLVIQPVRSE